MRVVQFTSEVQRVLALPRRAQGTSEDFARELSARLRRPGSKALLRPIQAFALYEIWRQRGLFGPIRVGAGKTLISLLAPYVLGLRRPVLLLPAKLIAKTEREMRLLANDWLIPNFIQIISYEWLGRSQAAQRLEHYRPDGIVADECHKLRNRNAAVTKRVRRHMAAHPETVFIGLSGTITKRSLKDYHALAGWALKPAGLPMPNGFGELEDWADALDEHTRERPNLGALAEIAKSYELADVREWYQKRLLSTPGVVATLDSRVSCSLSVTGHIVSHVRVDDHFTKLRKDWELPDEWTLNEAMAVWRHARELALGFYYRWDPRPPQEWLWRRKAWSRACRYILSNNARKLDSEKMVTKAVDEGLYPQIVFSDESKCNPRETLKAWHSIRDTFEPNTVPVWIDRTMLDWVQHWILKQDSESVVWVEHIAFAEELAKLTGLEYYGKNGQNRWGQPIERHGKGSLIASIASNAEGRNLQMWHSALVVSPPASGSTWEQMLGRLHRDGQTADEVSYDFVIACLEHISCMRNAFDSAKYVQQSTGQEQKLLYCDLTLPDTSMLLGPKWAITKGACE
jgi:hypothetical protein